MLNITPLLWFANKSCIDLELLIFSQSQMIHSKYSTRLCSVNLENFFVRVAPYPEKFSADALVYPIISNKEYGTSHPLFLNNLASKRSKFHWSNYKVTSCYCEIITIENCLLTSCNAAVLFML